MLHSQLLQEPKKLAVIGSGCSVATEPTAEISHYYNITQVSVNDMIGWTNKVRSFSLNHNYFDYSDTYLPPPVSRDHLYSDTTWSCPNNGYTMHYETTYIFHIFLGPDMVV